MVPGEIPPRSEWPKPGYYYKYKHDCSALVNHQAFYVIGISSNTSESADPEDQYMLIYRPLFPEAYVFKEGLLDACPLHEFFEMREYQGREVQRFTRITDPLTIAKLEAIRFEMYPLG